MWCVLVRFRWRSVKVGRRCWFHVRSSGIRVCTATGATAAMSSAGGASMHPLSTDMQFNVRTWQHGYPLSSLHSPLCILLPGASPEYRRTTGQRSVDTRNRRVAPRTCDLRRIGSPYTTTTRPLHPRGEGSTDRARSCTYGACINYLWRQRRPAFSLHGGVSGTHLLSGRSLTV